MTLNTRAYNILYKHVLACQLDKERESERIILRLRVAEVNGLFSAIWWIFSEFLTLE